MYAYHYWKCYHKEGSAFQAASIYSVEVDYYHYGTCEIADGAYFCGDHSCTSYKHIGTKDVQENSDLYATKGMPYTQYSSPQTGSLVNPTDTERATYDKYEGMYLNISDLVEPAVSSLTGIVQTEIFAAPLKDIHYGSRYTGTVTFLHEQEAFTAFGPGKCKGRCDEDPLCMAYQESRWETKYPAHLRAPTPTCYLFRFNAGGVNHYRSRWATAHISPDPAVSTFFRYVPYHANGKWTYAEDVSDFHVKISHGTGGGAPWDHLPKGGLPKARTAFPAQNPDLSSGRRLSSSQRLAGVY